MKAKLTVIHPACAVTAACIKAPTLEERLAGTTGVEWDKEAYYACLECSHYPIPGGHSGGYIGHETRMWALCDAMHEINQQENEHATR